MLCSGDARRPHHCLVYYLYKHIERDGDEALRKVLGRDHYDDDEGELTEYAGMNALSKAERDYISGGMAAGVREDGRNPTEVRCLEVEKDVIPHVNGNVSLVWSCGREATDRIELFYRESPAEYLWRLSCDRYGGFMHHRGKVLLGHACRLGCAEMRWLSTRRMLHRCLSGIATHSYWVLGLSFSEGPKE